MKKLFLTTLVILSSVACSQTKTDLQRHNLTGKVKSVRTIMYKAVEKLEQIEKGKIIWGGYLTIYNERGNVIELNEYHSDGSLYKKFTYKHDNKGDTIESNSYYSDGSLNEKRIYQYDDKGDLIEENRYNSNGNISSKYTFQNDDKGNRVEEKWYHPNGSYLDKKWTYKYDNKGDIIELNLYDSDGSFLLKQTAKYEYDKQGNWIKRMGYNHYDNSIEITERQIEYY